MNQDDRTKIKELAPGAFIEVQGYLSVVTEELKEIEQETGNTYGTLVTYRGPESFVLVTNLTKKPSLRVQVEKALEQITPENPVTIPSGTLAAQYAYAHAKQRGVRYRIKNGTVCLAESLSLRAQVLQILEELTEDNPVTIPPGIQASQYAYAHARERGLRYKITPGGIVSLAPKQEETRKIDLLKRLLNMEKDETLTEQVTQAYLRKVEDVSGYSFLLNDGDITRLK